MVSGKPISCKKKFCVGILQAFTQFEAHCDSSKNRHRLTSSPWLLPMVPSLSISTSLTSHSPINQVPAIMVAQAFIRAENAGNGFENRTAYDGGIQSGNSRPAVARNGMEWNIVVIKK